jgi:hypothetical protein
MEFRYESLDPEAETCSISAESSADGWRDHLKVIGEGSQE